MILETKGHLLVRSLPVPTTDSKDGLLCVKGRFGFSVSHDKQRIMKPLIRKNHGFEEATWEEALFTVGKKLESISFTEGADHIAVSISDQWTTEDMVFAHSFSKNVIKTPWITNFNVPTEGLRSVFGFDASPNTFEELPHTEFLLLIGSDTYTDHTMAAISIKKAVERGSKLHIINPSKTKLEEWASTIVHPENSLRFLKEICRALILQGYAPHQVTGWDSVKADLESIHPSSEARKIAEEYTKSKTALLLFDQHRVTPDAAKLIGYIALISGHIGKPRQGIIQLKPQNNSQSLPIVGVSADSREVLQKIRDHSLKALFVMGETIPSEDLHNLSFLAVMDTHLTKTAELADVFLPIRTYAESSGTYITTDRKVQCFPSALVSSAPPENRMILNQLARLLHTNDLQTSLAKIRAEMSSSILGLSYSAEHNRWTQGGNPVLYTERYLTPDGFAHMEVLTEGPLFARRMSTNHATHVFQRVLVDTQLERGSSEWKF